MVYVFRSKASTGARVLAEALDGKRIRQVENLNRLVRPGDTVVCWGEAWAKPGVIVLNGGPFRSKLADALRLREAGVATIEAAQTRPVAQAQPAPLDPALGLWDNTRGLAEEFTQLQFNRQRPTLDGLFQLQDAAELLRQALLTPAPVAPPAAPIGEWIARSNHHVGGTDLLNGTGNDYFVKKETITEEYRLHVFKGKSIRAGKKVQRAVPGLTVHPWIRSFDGGWKIAYDGFKSSQAMKDIAARAVEALGLDFGAVDIGKKADNSLIVLEVNRAPGLENNTIEAYAKAIEGAEEQLERAAA